MGSSSRSILLGAPHSKHHPSLVVVLALVVFLASAGAYAVDVFVVSGGVVWIPFHAALVGMLAGGWLGYARRGLLAAWVVAYASFLGYRADSAVSVLSGLAEQLAYFVRLDGLVVLAVEAVVVGTLAFALGALVRWGRDSVRSDAVAASVGDE